MLPSGLFGRALLLIYVSDTDVRRTIWNNVSSNHCASVGLSPRKWRNRLRNKELFDLGPIVAALLANPFKSVIERFGTLHANPGCTMRQLRKRKASAKRC